MSSRWLVVIKRTRRGTLCVGGTLSVGLSTIDLSRSVRVIRRAAAQNRVQPARAHDSNELCKAFQKIKPDLTKRFEAASDRFHGKRPAKCKICGRNLDARGRCPIRRHRQHEPTERRPPGIARV
jgi:hypothetical protein